MAKKNRDKSEISSKVTEGQALSQQPFALEKEAVDPSLALLFASSVSAFQITLGFSFHVKSLY
jgi:hypothetical protein